MNLEAWLSGGNTKILYVGKANLSNVTVTTKMCGLGDNRSTVLPISSLKTNKQTETLFLFLAFETGLILALASLELAL